MYTPADAGHAYMADKIAPLIAQQLHAPSGLDQERDLR